MQSFLDLMWLFFFILSVVLNTRRRDSTTGPRRRNHLRRFMLFYSKNNSGLKGKSYEERLAIMKRPSFSYRRLRGDLIKVYKFTHGFYKIKEGLLEYETRTNTRSHGYKLKKLRCDSSLRQHFFSLRVTDMRNKLPADIVDAPNTKQPR